MHLKPKTSAQYAAIDDFINEIRGLANTARLGQSATARAVENNLLLAPRYNRAIASLLWDTTTDGGIRGNEARLALRRSLTGLVSLGAAFSMAQYAINKDKKNWTMEGLGQEVLKHITPTSPEFFTWRVGGTNIGPGTKVRSLINLFAKSATDPGSLFSFSQKNPFTRFARGNAAPVLGDAWDIFSGHNYIGDPTGFYDGWTDDNVGENFSKLAKEVILPDIMPIWVHAALLEGGTPVERAARGATEFFGGRAYPLTRMQQRDEIAKEQFEGSSYEDLNRDAQLIVDSVAVERHGEEAFRGPLGPKRKEVEEVKNVLLAGLEDVTAQWLSASPGSEQFSPMIARVGTEDMDGLNKLRQNRIDALYGGWKTNLGRREGGLYDDLYDMDKPREEPEEGTREHRIWQYYQVFKDSTNPKTGDIDWEEYDKNISQFWANLKEGEVEEVLANIRVVEGEYPEQMKTMIDAGRYAGSTKLRIQGEDVSYWDIENHPLAVTRIAADAGVTEEQIRAYLDLPSIERKNKRDNTVIGGKIGRAFNKASAQDGILWLLKKRFVDNAPDEWILAMFDAGYSYQGSENINKRLKKQMRDGASKPQFGYDALYRQNLRRIR